MTSVKRFWWIPSAFGGGEQLVQPENRVNDWLSSVDQSHQMTYCGSSVSFNGKRQGAAAARQTVPIGGNIAMIRELDAVDEAKKY